MLSEREQQILVLVAQGLSNKQIALQLGISDNTVKVHLRNIFSKINVASRTEASWYAVRHGLLDVVSPAPEVSPEPNGSPLPGMPAVWRWWGVIGVVIVGIIAGIWWYGTPPQVPTQAATPTRWRVLPALPVAAPGVQLGSYRGVLVAVAGQQWWHLARVDGQWQEQDVLPCALAHGRIWADGAGVWMVGCGAGQATWLWDGQSWYARPAWPSAAQVVALTRVDGVLWAFTTTQVWQLTAQASAWQHMSDVPRGVHPMHVAVVDGGIYVFADDAAVWRVDTHTASWQWVQALPLSGHTMAASTVLGSVLLADATAATLWAYAPDQGVVSAQMVPPTVQLGTQAVQWQSYVVFPNRDGSALPAYQAVFQTFVPVVPEP